MAKEDVEIYEAYSKELTEAGQAALIVIPLIKANPLLAQYLGVSSMWRFEDGYMIHFNEEMSKKLKQLEEYMHCAHVQTKKHDDGHDSHKDYYHIACVKCGKIIESWSV